MMHESDPELVQKVTARDGYIAWRMTDVPAVYTALMPASYDMAELWDAENSIRSQYESDLCMAADPWKVVGPPCLTLDATSMESQDLIQFGIEHSIPGGLKRMPKPGRWDEAMESDPDAERLMQEHQDASAAKRAQRDAEIHSPQQLKLDSDR